MRKFRVAKRVLMLVLCGMLAVPAAGMLARPMVVEATPPVDPFDADDAIEELKGYYTIKKSAIKEAGNEKSADAVVKEAEALLKSPGLTEENLRIALSDAKAKLDALTVKEEPDPDPTPKTTNDNIMIGGNWVTPVANAGRHVNVVLPVVNMGRTRDRKSVV